MYTHIPQILFQIEYIPEHSALFSYQFQFDPSSAFDVLQQPMLWLIKNLIQWGKPSQTPHKCKFTIIFIIHEFHLNWAWSNLFPV